MQFNTACATRISSARASIKARLINPSYSAGRRARAKLPAIVRTFCVHIHNVILQNKPTSFVEFLFFFFTRFCKARAVFPAYMVNRWKQSQNCSLQTRKKRKLTRCCMLLQHICCALTGIGFRSTLKTLFAPTTIWSSKGCFVHQ